MTQEKISERVKTNLKDATFALAQFSIRLPIRTDRFWANAAVLIEAAYPLHARHERFAIETILSHSQGVQPKPFEVRRLTGQAVYNYTRQVFEVARILNHAHNPERAPWPSFTEPELTDEQETFFKTEGIFYIFHSGNLFSAAKFARKKIGPDKNVVVFMERQPRRVQQGYETLCAKWGITPFLVEEASSKALGKLTADFYLVHGERKGNANLEVTLCGETALLSKWTAFLSIEKQKPILPAMVVCTNENGSRGYTGVLGKVIRPKEQYPSPQDKKQGIEEITKLLAGETENFLARYPSDALLFSQVWKYDTK